MPTAAVNPKSLPTGRELRAKLLNQGFTYEEFAAAHGFEVATVYAVAAGRRGKRNRGVTGEIKAALAACINPR